jgi:hypothetical protein
VPVGTVPEDIGWRTHAALGTPVAERAADLERWRAQAPYKRSLAVDALRLLHGRRIPTAAAERELAPFLAYDVRALHEFASVAEPADREGLYRKICDLAVDQCGTLARYLVDEERDADAATIYRRWIGGAHDRVLASRNAAWLVDYEYTHDRKAEAWRLATEAAEVYSAYGLLALADLSERTGAYDKAEDLCRKIAERYDDRAPLVGFYLRARARGETRYDAAAAPLIAMLFPEGLERADVAAFTTGVVPDRGLSVRGPNRRLNAAGLRDGDVLVAVDGHRVRDYAQWQVVSRLSREPAMTFVYYRNGTYLAASGTFPRRAICDRLQNWVRPGTAAPARASR